MRFQPEDFTTKNYARLLVLTQKFWRFVTFDQLGLSEFDNNIVLWRHDIDASVHRAVKLAEIESASGVRATYFVQLSSGFYNVFEKDVSRRLVQIGRMGHQIGLHFDPGAYELDNFREFVDRLKLEQGILQDLLGCKVSAFSLHTPTAVPADMTGLEIEGLTNAYSAKITSAFKYCSDSNGYWRHERLEDILVRRDSTRLHVLTHPEYWTDEALSAQQRIERCIEGRSRSTRKNFYGIVLQTGRMIPGDEAVEEGSSP